MVMSPVVVLICSSMKLLFFESRADAASLPLDTIKFPPDLPLAERQWHVAYRASTCLARYTRSEIGCEIQEG